MANSNCKQEFLLLSLLWLSYNNNTVFVLCKVNFGRNSAESTLIGPSVFAQSPTWLTAHLCKAFRWRSWCKDKQSTPQIPELWFWACEQHSASWEWTRWACTIQLRRECVALITMGTPCLNTLTLQQEDPQNIPSKQILSVRHPVLFKFQASHKWLKNNILAPSCGKAWQGFSDGHSTDERTKQLLWDESQPEHS